MNTFDLLNAIGDVDDILVAKAKHKTKSHKAIWVRIGSLAACLMLLFAVPVVFIAMQGANSSSPESMRTENTTPDYEIVRIEVITDHGSRSVADPDSIKQIHTEILAIIENETKDPVESTEDNIRIESVTSNSETKEMDGIYRLNFRHHEGEILKYELYGNTLKDLSTGKEYRLTMKEAEYILSLLDDAGDR